METKAQLDGNEKKILDLETQVEVLQRKLDNSKILISTTENFARLAQAREAKATNMSRKTRERLDDLEARLQIKRLQKACDQLDEEIECKEKQINEIEYYGECLNLPVKTDERRKLKILKREVHESRKLRDGQYRLLSSLVDRQNQMEEMRTAAANGDIVTVKRLLSLGISVNIADNGGICAFKYACGQGHMDIVKTMIGVSYVNNLEGGWPPLHYAVKYNQLQIVDFLLQKKARIDELDGCEPPLHVACKHGHLEVFHLLIDSGANVNQANKFGDACLHFLSQSNTEITNQEEMVSRLLEKGADVEKENLDGLTPLTISKTQRMYGVLQLLKDARTSKNGT
jgi:ankyrin repeat protein